MSMEVNNIRSYSQSVNHLQFSESKLQTVGMLIEKVLANNGSLIHTGKGFHKNITVPKPVMYLITVKINYGQVLFNQLIFCNYRRLDQIPQSYPLRHFEFARACTTFILLHQHCQCNN